MPLALLELVEVDLFELLGPFEAAVLDDLDGLDIFADFDDLVFISLPRPGVWLGLFC